MPSNPDIWRDFSPIRKIVAKKYPIESHLHSGSPEGRFLVGVNGERVPFETNRAEDFEPNTGGIPDQRFRYIRIGNLAFVDHRLRRDIPKEVLDDFKNNLVWLWKFRSGFCEPTHLQYSPLTIHALTNPTFRESHILDLGSGDGILGLTALKVGITRVTSVEKYEGCAAYYNNHLDANRFDQKGLNWITGDLSKPEDILPRIEEPTPDVAVSNIGPWYKGDPHLAAIRLAARIPTIKTFIAGAFIKEHHNKSPEESRKLLADLGFNSNYRELTYNTRCQAFIVDRQI